MPEIEPCPKVVRDAAVAVQRNGYRQVSLEKPIAKTLHA